MCVCGRIIWRVVVSGKGLFMFRSIVLMLFVAISVSACAIASESGGASEPVVSVVNATTEAGSLAISTSAVDPLTCDGVLAPITGDLELSTQAITDSAKSAQPQIVSMCSAMYDSGIAGREFLALALIEFDSADSAVAHYELMKGAFVEAGVPISELNNASDDLIDRVSGLMDSDGVGRTTVMRQKAWVISVSVGPTTAESPWIVGDMEMIGKGVLGRVQ
jgi:hypothetical protein